MKKNMGKSDRRLRVLLAAGAVAGSAVLGFSTAGGIVLLVVAGIMLVTASSARCPVYSILGIKTTSAVENNTGHRARTLDHAA